LAFTFVKTLEINKLSERIKLIIFCRLLEKSLNNAFVSYYELNHIQSFTEN